MQLVLFCFRRENNGTIIKFSFYFSPIYKGFFRIFVQIYHPFNHCRARLKGILGFQIRQRFIQFTVFGNQAAAFQHLKEFALAVAIIRFFGGVNL